jgi:polyhydroxyalkanoate synthesis regulator phasin
MFAEERQKVIEMVADGKISAEEAVMLIRALNEDESEDGDSFDEGDW